MADFNQFLMIFCMEFIEANLSEPHTSGYFVLYTMYKKYGD